MSSARALFAPTVGLVLLAPVALFIAASLLKYSFGLPSLYDGIGFLADPQRLPWYNRISPILFLGGPLPTAALSLGTIMKLDLRRDTGQVLTVGIASLVLLVVLGIV